MISLREHRKDAILAFEAKRKASLVAVLAQNRVGKRGIVRGGRYLAVVVLVFNVVRRRQNPSPHPPQTFFGKRRDPYTVHPSG